MRVASTVVLDATGGAKATAEPIASPHVERFSPESVGDPKTLADGLTRIVKAMADLARAVFAQRRAQSVTFENVVCKGSGAKVLLPHNLGMRVRWCVVGWRGAGMTSGPSLVSDELDAVTLTTSNTLALRSYVAGTCDIEVF